MRRFLSIVLLVVSLSPSFVPMPAFGQGSEASLPACCRREGKHHCIMSMGERNRLAVHDPHFQAPPETCPYCPAAVNSAHPDRGFTPSTQQAVFAAILSHPSGCPQGESKRRISRDRSRQKRGPPARLSSL